MSRHLRHLFVVTVILSLPAFSSYTSVADAQEQLTADQSVTRVIRLRSSESPQVQTPSAGKTQSSRAERIARRPATLADPAQIEFEEISPAQAPPQPAMPMQSFPANPTFPAPIMVEHEKTPVENRQSQIPGVADWKDKKDQSMPAIATSTGAQITTMILAPKFVNVNEPVSVTIQLQNVSRQTAKNIKLVATLPAHVKFASSQPQPANVDGQRYEFLVHEIDAHQLHEIKIELVPNEKMPIEILTQTQVVDSQNFAVVVRQPALRVDISGPERANTGQWIEHLITVQNTGDGVAENIQLTRKLPSDLQVEKDKSEFMVPSLEPGESSIFTARTYCETAGEFELGFDLSGKNLDVQSSVRRLTVFQPELEIAAVWPNMNFINRDGIYSIQIDNTGQVDVTNVQINLIVPEGFEITTVSRQATIDATTGALVWLYDRLPADSHETIQLKATTKTAGRQVCKLTIRSSETEGEQLELVTEVATRADVSISLSNQGGPIEVGGNTEFVIGVVNKGSSTATDVEVLVELASSLMPVTNDGYVVNEIDNSIRFNYQEIQPGETKELSFTAVGVTTGEHVVRGVVTMKGSQRRLIAEDSVYVFEVDKSRISESLKPTINRK